MVQQERKTIEKEVKGYKAFYFQNERNIMCCRACGALFIQIEKETDAIKSCIFCGSERVVPVTLKKEDGANV